jgi:hypothetical protein
MLTCDILFFLFIFCCIYYRQFIGHIVWKEINGWNEVSMSASWVSTQFQPFISFQPWCWHGTVLKPMLTWNKKNNLSTQEIKRKILSFFFFLFFV